MPLDERRHILVTIAVESFGHPGRERNYSFDQLVTSVIGGRDGGVMGKKGI